MQIEPPYLLFLGDAPDALAVKTAQGIVDWRPEWAAGQLRFETCGADLGIPDMTLDQAVDAGVQTLVIGAVNPGGRLPSPWVETLLEALEAGFDIASGMHTRLTSIQSLVNAAQMNGCKLFDVRHSTESFATGSGEKRAGKRLLTVGTDCSVGKKYAALALEREMRVRGLNAEFRATGQTGIFISGRGVSIDAVVADFISGAAEWISSENTPDHWDIVEGQGSLLHPSFAGVSLGLLHGSQPDAFVVCHEPTRTRMRNVNTPIPPIQTIIDLTIALGRLTNPAIRCVGLAVNTSALTPDDARTYLADLSAQFGLPAADPIATGVGPIVDRLLAEEI